MAITTLIRILDKDDRQIDDLFTRFSLLHPSHDILNEDIMASDTTAAMVINACGEATIMLNKMKNSANNNIECTTLAVAIWSRLFKHVNRARKTKHISLIMENVTQLMGIHLKVSNLPYIS